MLKCTQLTQALAALLFGLFISTPIVGQAQDTGLIADELLDGLSDQVRQIEADAVKLRRTNEYQRQLLELALQDPAAAEEARRGRDNCIAQGIDVEICDLLSESFPESPEGEN